MDYHQNISLAFDYEGTLYSTHLQKSLYQDVLRGFVWEEIMI